MTISSTVIAISDYLIIVFHYFIEHAVYMTSLIVTNVLTLIITTIIVLMVTKKYYCKDKRIDSQQQQQQRKTVIPIQPKVTDNIAYGTAFDESDHYYL